MKRFKTFALFLLLILLWSSFFGAFKLYFWSVYSSTIHPSLESIAGYLGFGGIFAYLLWGALAEAFHKRSLLIACSLGTLALLAVSSTVGGASWIAFAASVMAIGFFYSLWAVLKNVLISVEIHRTGLPDSVVTGLVNIVFIVFLVAGVVLGPILSAKFGLMGSFVLAALLVLALGVAIPLDYENEWHFTDVLKKGWNRFFRSKRDIVCSTFRSSVPEMKQVIVRYGIIILSVALLWSISTIVSQKSVEISREVFGKTESQASLLLLYSSIGAIFWNLVSMALQKWRWTSFAIANALFAALVLAFPPIVEYSLRSNTYSALIALALAIGAMFGAASNLIEGYYFKKLYDDNVKEYGAAAYGLALSTVLTVMMAISGFVTSWQGHSGSVYLCGGLVVAIGLAIHLRVPKNAE